MSPNDLSQLEFLKTIRMSRVHAASEKRDFITHIYQSILGREPDAGALSNPVTLSAGDSWDRVFYLGRTLLSEESRGGHNKDYPDFLATFFSALGYVEAGKILVGLMMDIAPDFQLFESKSDNIFRIVAMNTQRMFFGVGSEEIFNELDGALSLKQMAARLSAIEQEVHASRAEMRDLAWHLNDIRGRLTGSAPSQNGDDYVHGLLLAILARLEMQGAQ